jgi:rRNA-processing protein EBP2
MFDVALEDAAVTDKADRASRRAGGGGRGRDGGKDGRGRDSRDGGGRDDAGGPPNRKRQKKDSKFGFGGKKRFAKSNDATSAGDTRSFSVKKMKGKGGKQQRPGKSKRAKMG